jgi:hypothetical protein
MKYIYSLVTLLLSVFIIGCSGARYSAELQPGEKWQAVHLLGYEDDSSLAELEAVVPKLDSMGINTIFLEVDYHFEFKSHPELRQGTAYITKAGAEKFTKICSQYGIQVIPQFQSLGHQSWAEKTFPLLTVYPQFDLTPGAFPGNKDIYCREWDVTNPEVYKIVYDLIDELIDAFDARAFHVGMDEIFLLGSEQSPNTKGKDPGILYAKAVNDMYNHIVKKRGLQMLMWSDRLLDGEKFKFGEWEASMNGTAKAVDMIPKDIILCPWHYEKMDGYPSIPYFIEKGFRVLPASWRDVECAKLLINYSYNYNGPLMLGHMFTTWQKVDLMNFPALTEGIGLVRSRGNE